MTWKRAFNRGFGTLPPPAGFFRRMIPFIISVLVGSAGVGCGDNDSSSRGSKDSIQVAISEVTSSHVTLTVTANFNGHDVPLWRNGHFYFELDLVANKEVLFTDRDVVSGRTYTYKAGGYVFLGGEIWSNIVTVTVP